MSSGGGAADERRDTLLSMNVSEEFLRQSIELAAEARRNGNHPFGALLVLDDSVVIRARNTVLDDRNPTSHAESNLAQMAIRDLTTDERARATLYTSCEPCAMCSGAIYWAGIRKIVYALSSDALARVAGENGLANCRVVFTRIGTEMEVEGPFLIEDALEPHKNFWQSSPAPF